jgi:hypothetical protein
MKERKGAIVHGMVDDALWEDSDKEMSDITLVTHGLAMDGRQS